jgi:hypothetical protein
LSLLLDALDPDRAEAGVFVAEAHFTPELDISSCAQA